VTILTPNLRDYSRTVEHHVHLFTTTPAGISGSRAPDVGASRRPLWRAARMFARAATRRPPAAPPTAGAPIGPPCEGSRAAR
jgi:hypothetical protein